MQTHAEHQQHDPYFSELRGELDIGDKTGGGGPDHDARDQVTHEKRQSDPDRDRAHEQREPQGGRNRGDQVEVVEHALARIIQGVLRAKGELSGRKAMGLSGCALIA